MRCDSYPNPSGTSCWRFNPHTYMRCDARPTTTPTGLFCFNPHTYMRCDTGWWKLSIPNWPFQSTHLHEVWPFCDKIKINPNQFQSTHLHEVWRHSADFGKTFNEVSIHTPTWGVTVTSAARTFNMKVSIHTPTWGVTRQHDTYPHAWRGFNPHTYMRCDLRENIGHHAVHVSIHTPTWGVTYFHH